MYKGKLHKTEDTWVVDYSDYDFTGMPVVGIQFPLYPGPLPLPEGMGIDDYLYEGHVIDFVTVSENGAVAYAKPIIPQIGVYQMSESMTAEEFDKRCPLFFNSQKMIEFAKFHVEAALKAAAENVKIDCDPYYPEHEWVDKDSILNAYPLDNIK